MTLADLPPLALPFLLGYALGSIPFGLLLTRLFGAGDIRSLGSGNIGATNVLRTGRKGLAAATLLLDGGKGAAAVLLAGALWPAHPVAGTIAGFGALIGHCFPLWLRFKGGKGVATTIGVLFALNPLLGLAVCGMWAGMFLLSRISSLSSLMDIGYSPIIAYLLDNYLIASICLNLAALILFTHRGNITRLLQGTEPTFRKRHA